MKPETMILADGTEITIVHFVVTQSKGYRTRPFIACVPGLENFASNSQRENPWMRTDEPRSVTCPLCKGSKEHAEALEKVR